MTQIMPQTAPYVAQRIIQLSLSHGLSPVSPVGFVHLGSYIAKLGDISGGYHYVKLALSLLDKVGSRESAGEVICIGTQVRVYVEPLQATLDYHNEGYAAAMASGDTIQAALNKMLSCGTYFVAGVNLQTVREKYAEAIKFMEEKKHVIFMVQLRYQQHSILRLIGTDEEPKYVSAEEQNILATNSSVMTTYYYQKTYISFMFRSYDDTKHYAEKYLACIGTTWANLFLGHAHHAFFIGLISFWFARKSRDGQQWHEMGKRSKLVLKIWAESSRWTFENKWHLLEAEESFCNNDFDAAKTYYEKAVTAAKNHKVSKMRSSEFNLITCLPVFNVLPNHMFVACPFSLYTKKLWLVSCRRTFIWRSEILTNQCTIFCLHMRSITSGEHWGNAPVCSSLFKTFLLRHLLALALALATQILLETATTKEIESDEWNNIFLFGRKRDSSE
jgi:hypothetical protein